jgi:F0F1-type ATP synthase assembly protein I
MKLIPQNLRAPNMNDSVGRGMDMALTMALFIGIGFGLDRWLGTTPWFMIGLTVLAGVGLFARFKYQYDAAMDEHEAERRERAGVGKGDDRDG